MHEFEWTIGEAAGRLAAFCVAHGVTPRRVEADPSILRQFQRRLAYAGVPLYWYADVGQKNPAFAAGEILASRGLWPGRKDNLLFHPGAPLTLREADELMHTTPALQRERIVIAAGLTATHPVSRGEFARAWARAIGD